MTEASSRKRQWRQYFRRDFAWATKKHQQVKKQEAVIINSWMKKYSGDEIRILELGCGDGYLGAEVLKLNDKIKTWYYTDLLPECLKLAKKNNSDHRASFHWLDALHFREEKDIPAISCIVSTGYASVASYAQVIPRAAKVLKKNQLLIIDFINHFSLEMIFDLPKSLKKYLSGQIYHLGPVNVEKYFRQFGLQLLEMKPVKSYLRGPLIGVFKKI